MQFGVLFKVLVMARVHFREIDGGVLWGCFCEIDRRVLIGVLFGRRCWRCWCTIVGMFFSLPGVYMGVISFLYRDSVESSFFRPR